MSEQFCILTFGSVHRVIKAENILKNAAIWNDMIPSPRGITSDCGMSLKVYRKDLEALRGALVKGNMPPFAVYRQEGKLYIKEEDENGTHHQTD